jgi:protein O-GlcNAc transferase
MYLFTLHACQCVCYCQTGDFMGTHPLTHLMQSVFSMHNSTSIELYIYALNSNDGSAQRSAIESTAGAVFTDLSSASASEAAATIAAHACDVLVNLNGYAGTVKSAEIFAQRPCPLSISYMGYPGTMGATFTDYLLADTTVVPQQLRQHYSERIIALPHCYFVNDYRQSQLVKRAIEDPLPSRVESGLPVDPNVTVLCNFNRLHKLDPATFQLWMQVFVTIFQCSHAYMCFLREVAFIYALPHVYAATHV